MGNSAISEWQEFHNVSATATAVAEVVTSLNFEILKFWLRTPRR